MQCLQRFYFSIAVDDKVAAKLFSSQNKSSSSERDFLTPCNMHLTPCNMQKILHDSVQYAENIARLLQYKVNGNLFSYIIKEGYIITSLIFFSANV